MRIGEMAAATGLSVDTLRYYERIGLLPRPARDGAGHRVYQARDLDWLQFLMRLRDTGMPLTEMRRYAALRAAGPATAPARRDLLAAHRAAVREKLARWTACLSVLDAKITAYDQKDIQ